MSGIPWAQWKPFPFKRDPAQSESAHPWDSHRIFSWLDLPAGWLVLGKLTSVLHSKGQALIESAQSLWWRGPCHSCLGALVWHLSPAPAILTGVEEGTQVPTSLGCQCSDSSPFAEGQALILTPGNLAFLFLYLIVCIFLLRYSLQNIFPFTLPFEPLQ